MTDATAAKPTTGKKHPLDGVENGSVGPNEARVYNKKTGVVKLMGLRTAASLGPDWVTVMRHGEKPEAVKKRVAALKK